MKRKTTDENLLVYLILEYLKKKKLYSNLKHTAICIIYMDIKVLLFISSQFGENLNKHRAFIKMLINARVQLVASPRRMQFLCSNSCIAEKIIARSRCATALQARMSYTS